MDKIKLMQEVEHEYAPRYYTMTGGTFDEMLAAVKALDHRRFQSYPVKAWTVRREGLDTLRNQQYTVEQDPDFRGDEFNERTMRDEGDRVTVTAYFELRSSRGWINVFNQILSSPLTDEDIEAEKQRIDNAAKEHFPDLDIPPANRYQAVREIARRAVREFGKEAVAAFEEATGSERTGDAFEAGIEAVKALRT